MSDNKCLVNDPFNFYICTEKSGEVSLTFTMNPENLNNTAKCMLIQPLNSSPLIQTILHSVK